MLSVRRVELVSPFTQMRDEEVIPYARAGSALATEYLLRKYRSLVEGKARAYYLVGAEHEDVVQEGMIGLYKAIRDYSEGGLSAFRSFAELCVTRQIITAIKTATRQKHRLFNDCASLDRQAGEEEQADLREALVDTAMPDAEHAVLSHAFCQELAQRMDALLSDLEAQALLGYLNGQSYRAISSRLGCQVKQIDNALQRAKKKLSDALGRTTDN